MESRLGRRMNMYFDRDAIECIRGRENMSRYICDLIRLHDRDVKAAMRRVEKARITPRMVSRLHSLIGVSVMDYPFGREYMALLAKCADGFYGKTAKRIRFIALNLCASYDLYVIMRERELRDHERDWRARAIWHQQEG